MGVKKQRDVYYISYDGKTRIEVSEEVYRSWAYHTNKEIHGSKKYRPSLARQKDGTSVIKPSVLLSLDDVLLSNTVSLGTYSPEAYLEHRFVTDLLETAITQLPDMQADIIYLIFYEGLSETQIGRRLGVCQATVSNHKHRALAAMRDMLLERGFSREDLYEMLND